MRKADVVWLMVAGAAWVAAAVMLFVDREWSMALSLWGFFTAWLVKAGQPR